MYNLLKILQNPFKMEGLLDSIPDSKKSILPNKISKSFNYFDNLKFWVISELSEVDDSYVYTQLVSVEK